MLKFDKTKQNGSGGQGRERHGFIRMQPIGKNHAGVRTGVVNTTNVDTLIEGVPSGNVNNLRYYSENRTNNNSNLGRYSNIRRCHWRTINYASTHSSNDFAKVDTDNVTPVGFVYSVNPGSVDSGELVRLRWAIKGLDMDPNEVVDSGNNIRIYERQQFAMTPPALRLSQTHNLGWTYYTKTGGSSTPSIWYLRMQVNTLLSSRDIFI